MRKMSVLQIILLPLILPLLLIWIILLIPATLISLILKFLKIEHSFKLGYIKDED